MIKEKEKEKQALASLTLSCCNKRKLASSRDHYLSPFLLLRLSIEPRYVQKIKKEV
jgi:hypothetical protein